MNTETVEQIFVEDIIPNRFQPRSTFNDKDLRNLSDSIKNYGIIQPLILRKIGNKYEIIAGERRYKAACIAGLKTVPAIVRNLTDDESAEIALIENLQRKNLTSIEEAQSYQYLLNRGYVTEEKLANTLGIDKSTIDNKLKLLQLSEVVQNALLNNRISEGHARSLLRLTNTAEQQNMLNRTINERLTVKQLDNEINKVLNIDSNDHLLDETEGMDTMNTNQDNIKTDNTTVDDTTSSLTNNEKPKTNIFGFQIPSESELESEAPNLDTETKGEEPMEQIGFNPFAFSVNDNNNQTEETTDTSSNNSNESTDSEDLEKFEMFDIFGDSVNPNEQADTDKETEETPKSFNLGDEINKVRELISIIKTDGFKVEMEEYDLEDVYQINIRIQKQSVE